MIVRELLTLIGLKVEDEGFSKASMMFNVVAKAAGAVVGVVGAVAAAVGAATIKAVRYGDQIGEAAERIGITTDALQELGYAVEQGGASASDLEMGFKSLSMKVDAFRSGSKEATKTFKAFGISLQDTRKLSLDQLFEKASDGLAGMTDQTRRAALAQDLLGRAGTRLIPTMLKGAAGIQEFRQTARDLGIVMSQETIVQADRLADRWGAISSLVGGLVNKIGSALIPKLNEVAKEFLGIVEANKAWINLKTHEAIEFIRKAWDLAVDGAMLFIASLGFVKGSLDVLWDRVFKPLVGWIADIWSPAFEGAFGWLNLLAGLMGEKPSNTWLELITALARQLKNAWENSELFRNSIKSTIGLFTKGTVNGIASLMPGGGAAMALLDAVSMTKNLQAADALVAPREFVGPMTPLQQRAAEDKAAMPTPRSPTAIEMPVPASALNWRNLFGMGGGPQPPSVQIGDVSIAVTSAPGADPKAVGAQAGEEFSKVVDERIQQHLMWRSASPVNR